MDEVAVTSMGIDLAGAPKRHIPWLAPITVMAMAKHKREITIFFIFAFMDKTRSG
jgi:hypothetical protein